MKLELGLDADDLCELGIIPQRWLQDGRKVMVHRCLPSRSRMTYEEAQQVSKQMQGRMKREKFQGTSK